MNLPRLYSFLALMASNWNAWAQSAETEAAKAHVNPVSHFEVLQWLLALVAVLALFAGLVWLLRKSGAFSLNNKNQLAILAGLSLGVRERLVLVKVGEQQLLLGITPGRMEKLLVLEGDQRLFQNQEVLTDQTSFAQKLEQVLKGHSHD
jgi:flagellar protein FliO/FliZ